MINLTVVLYLVLTLFHLHSFFCIVKAHVSLRRNTRSACRWQRVKVCPGSSTTCSPEPKVLPPPCSVSEAQVVYRKTHNSLLHLTSLCFNGISNSFFFLKFLLCTTWRWTLKITKLPLSSESFTARNTKLTWVWGEWVKSVLFTANDQMLLKLSPLVMVS